MDDGAVQAGTHARLNSRVFDGAGNFSDFVLWDQRHGPVRKSHHLLRIFEGRRSYTRQHWERGALREQQPYLWPRRLQGVLRIDRHM